MGVVGNCSFYVANRISLDRHPRWSRDKREFQKIPIRILRDEVRHRAFGWTLLGWMLETPHAPSLRGVIERELPGWFRRIRRSYAPAYAERLDTISDVDRAWGLMAPARYGAVVERTWERDWKPRFAKLSIDAAPAWERAKAAP